MQMTEAYEIAKAVNFYDKFTRMAVLLQSMYTYDVDITITGDINHVDRLTGETTATVTINTQDIADCDVEIKEIIDKLADICDRKAALLSSQIGKLKEVC